MKNTSLVTRYKSPRISWIHLWVPASVFIKHNESKSEVTWNKLYALNTIFYSSMPFQLHSVQEKQKSERERERGRNKQRVKGKENNERTLSHLLSSFSILLTKIKLTLHLHPNYYFVMQQCVPLLLCCATMCSNTGNPWTPMLHKNRSQQWNLWSECWKKEDRQTDTWTRPYSVPWSH